MINDFELILQAKETLAGLVNVFHSRSIAAGFWKSDEIPDKLQYTIKSALTAGEQHEAIEAERQGNIVDGEDLKEAYDLFLAWKGLENLSEIREVEKTEIDAAKERFVSFFKGKIKDTREDEDVDTFIRLLDKIGYICNDENAMSAFVMHIALKHTYNTTRGEKHGKEF